MRIYGLLLCGWMTVSLQAQQIHDWENHHVLQINREPARAAFVPFAKQKGDCSMSLDGMWKFRWTPVPSERIADFYRTDFNDEDWKSFPVPANWEINGYGTPIYVSAGYPFKIDPELIEVIANNPKVMKYLDLPIQHISNNILKMMARKTNKETIIGKINLLREKVPGITLRTSLIVGFPGETEEDSNELCRFLKNYKLDNVGVFTYSQEEGTAAAKLPNQVDEDVKIKRKEKLMNIQRGIVKDLNKLKIGNIYDTIIDGSTGEYYIGRNYEMAPEIDGLIYITKGKVLKKGDIIKVKITNIMAVSYTHLDVYKRQALKFQI